VIHYRTGQESFLFAEASTPTPRNTPIPYPLIIGEELFPCPSSGHSIMLTTHLHLLPRLRMAIAVAPLPIHVHSMHRDFATLTESLKEIVFMKHVQVL
jgi:hypothetical protein